MSKSVCFDNGKLFNFANAEVKDSTIDIFILAGQSNAHGHANVSALSSSKQSQNGLFHTSWHQNTSNAETTQYYTDWMTSLNAGSTRGSGTSSTLSGSNYFGPELGFVSQANAINLTNGRPIGIIKYAVGASTLLAGSSRSDWDTTATGFKEGDCWRGFQGALSDAITKLNNAGYSWKFKGMIWWQGESGSSVSGLRKFIAAVRNLLGDSYNVSNSSQFPVVITKIGYGTDLTPVANADAYIGIVDAGAFGHGGGSQNHIGTSSNPDTTGNGVNDMFDIGEAYANTMQLVIAGNTNSAWSPASLSTLLWLDMNDETTLTSSNGSVMQIADKSGNNYTFFADSGSTITSVSSDQNGKHILRFTGNSDYTQVTNVTFASSTRHKWYFVLKTTNVDNALDAWVAVTGGNNQHILMGLSGSEFRGKWYVQQSGGLKVSDIDLNNSWNILTVEWDDATGLASSWLNGNLVEKNKVFRGGLNGIKAVRINKYQQAADSDWGEILFTENVSQTNSDKIEGYLAHKWGLAGYLPSMHPHKSSAP